MAEAGPLALCGVLFLSMALFEPYSTEMPERDEIGGRVEREHLDLGDRLGYAILLSAGYAEADFVTEAERDTVIAREKRMALEEAAALKAARAEEPEAGAEGGEDARDGKKSDGMSHGSTANEMTDEANPTSADSLPEEPEAEAEEEDSPGSRWDVGLHLMRIEHADLACTGGGAVEVKAAYQHPIYTEELTIALLAAEKYNRSSFQRRVEGWLARLSLRLRNKLPEYTYGLAQLRPSVARALLASEVGSDSLPDREVLALLTNTCHSARLAESYVDSLARKFAQFGSTNEILERIIRAYNGASSETVHGMRYVDAVRGAYELLVQEYDDLETISERQNEAVTCLQFSFASRKGGTDEGGGEYSFPYKVLTKLDTAAAPAEAVITYYIEQSAEEGPPSYRERMMARRREWLRSELINVGFSGTRIRWAEAEARARLARQCSAAATNSWGAAEVSPARRAASPNAPAQ